MKPGTRRWLLALACPWWLACCGCPFPTEPNSPTTDKPPSSSSSSVFDSATVLGLDAGDSDRQVNGIITGRTDRDLYGLGPMAAGDMVTIDVRRVNGNLDAVAAVFDANVYVIAYNDDRAADGSDLNPVIQVVFSEPVSQAFLAIIAYPSGNTTGGYQVTIQVRRGVGVLVPRHQIVYLNWQGGNDITIPNVGVYNLPPFSASDVGLAAGDTAALKASVQAIVEQRYSAYNLFVLGSDNNPVPTEAHSTVYFGGHDYAAFAISEQVDSFNKDPGDDAIIFTQSYVDAFQHQPTFEEMAQALGNTVAHEVGHLLGLLHTASCDDLMDTTCSNDRLLQEQFFGTAPLDTSVFPFGYQDSPDILTWLLGLVGG